MADDVSARMPEPPYYAVVFTSHRADDSRRAAEDPGYEATALRMRELAAGQPGYLGMESARGADGVGITVSYWSDLESVRRWGAHAEHLMAQRFGRERWYDWFRVKICRVERAREFGWDEPQG